MTSEGRRKIEIKIQNDDILISGDLPESTFTSEKKPAKEGGLIGSKQLFAPYLPALHRASKMDMGESLEIKMQSLETFPELDFPEVTLRFERNSNVGRARSFTLTETSGNASSLGTFLIEDTGRPMLFERTEQMELVRYQLKDET